jgi:carbon storage regulator
VLVLSRKLSEKIVINKDIIITVVEIRGDKIRLGFDAPKEIHIVRSELLDPTPQRTKSWPQKSGCPHYAIQDRSLYL